MKNCFVFGEYLSHLPSKTPSNESNRKIISLFYWLLLRTFPTKSHTSQSIFALPSTRLKVTLRAEQLWPSEGPHWQQKGAQHFSQLSISCAVSSLAPGPILSLWPLH